MRLGFAVQLGTVRFLGTFLDEPAAVPAGVVADLARQLAITDPGCLAQYDAGRVRWLRASEIRERHGYRKFTDPFMRFRLARWLYALCWTGTDRPNVLFDRATTWLVTEKVLLPGASALERLVSRIRARAARRLWRILARDVTREQRAQLDALLLAGAGGRPSPLDRLRDGPYLRSGAELSRAVIRLDEVRALALGLPGTAHVPPGRVAALARFAMVTKAQAVARLQRSGGPPPCPPLCGRWRRARRMTCWICSTSWSRPCSPTPPRSASAPGCGLSATLMPPRSSSAAPGAC